MSLKERQQCIGLVKEAKEAGAGKLVSCQLLGLSLRTLERWEKHPDREDQRSGPKSILSKSLTQEEKEKMLQVANSEEYRDLSPHQIVVKLADSGQYIASESSFYRVLKAANLLAHRSKCKLKTRHPPRCLIAKIPNQVWSWDITYLMTTVKGKYFYLYMVEDIFSRLIVGWRIDERESSEFGADLVERCCIEQSVKKEQVSLHADNGSPMIGATMLATLQRLGVIPSFSRPSVSNDNPYSESLFKTLKYCPQFPGRPFSTLQEAQAWVDQFVTWYNTKHLHSEIRYVTPQSRHNGLDRQILKSRAQVYEQAKATHPLRWSKQIRNWTFIGEVFLNPGKEQKNAILKN